MSVIEIRSTMTHRALMHRSRRDLEQRLAEIARAPGLNRDAIAGAIMYLANRIPA